MVQNRRSTSSSGEPAVEHTYCVPKSASVFCSLGPPLVLDSEKTHFATKVREAREQSLAECLKREFRLTINILRSCISGDVYEGIRALTIDKDNAPKWDPDSLEKVKAEDLDKVFQPYEAHLELQVPEREECRWDGKYENSAYATSKV